MQVLIHNDRTGLTSVDGVTIDWDKLEDVATVIKAWADQQFPNRTPHHALCKLILEEVPEFLMDQDSPGEYADLLILILDIASLRGINIRSAVREKMIVNMKRTWAIDETTGIMKHV